MKQDKPQVVEEKIRDRMSHITDAVDRVVERHTQQTTESSPSLESSKIKTLSVDYDQYKPETYRGVVLRNGDTHELRRWFGKGFNQDWVDAINDCDHDKSLQPFMLDSSVHSYNQDVVRRTR
jgi:hypothetical protein